jgi:exonuclease III
MRARAVEEAEFMMATLNINGITSRAGIGMLAKVLREQDIDVMFVQKVTVNTG